MSIQPQLREKAPLEWLSQIISPSGDGKMMLAESGQPSDKTTPQFGWLSLSDGRGFLIPMDSRAVSWQGLQLYNGQTLKAKIASIVSKFSLSVGLTFPFMKKVIWVKSHSSNDADLYLFDYIAKVLNRDNIAFSLSLGTLDVYGKPVIQIMDQSGDILGYARVGWNTWSIPLVQQDAMILEQVTSVKSFGTPHILYAGSWHDLYISIQSPPKEKSTSAPTVMNEQYFDILCELATINAVQQLFEASALYTQLEQDMSKLPADYPHSAVLQQAFQLIKDRLQNKEVHMCLSHGDFAPWNAKQVGNRLFIFDWEYGEKQMIGGWDLVHFLHQTQQLLGHYDEKTMHESFQPSGEAYSWLERYVNHLQQSSDIVSTLVIMYWLFMVLRYYQDESAQSRVIYLLNCLKCRLSNIDS